MSSGDSRKKLGGTSGLLPSFPLPIPLCITCFSPGNQHARKVAGTAPPSCIFGSRNGFEVLVFICL